MTHPDRLDESLFLRIDKRPPYLLSHSSTTDGAVHEVQVKVLQARCLEGRAQGTECLVVSPVGLELGSEEKIGSRSVALLCASAQAAMSIVAGPCPARV